jgi:hypothetical protein
MKERPEMLLSHSIWFSLILASYLLVLLLDITDTLAWFRFFFVVSLATVLLAS